MSFFQTPPELGNQYQDDRLLRSYLARVLQPLSDGQRRQALQELDTLGDITGHELYPLQQMDRDNEPVLTQWDPWGRRVDRVEVTAVWKRAREIACEFGLVGTAYERKFGALSRVLQFAKVYLFEPSSDVYSCPLAMTDGAAKTLQSHHNAPLVERALGRLVSRDARVAWTSGQWMTERTGGSDVSRTETVAKRTPDGFRLYGTKWFTSATTADMALTLARPEGNPEGSRGLALFYVERFAKDGSSNGIFLNRLKDKLGTRKLPTAELTLDGALAEPVVGLTDGVRAITPMLNVTRLWNSVCAAAAMRRAMALSRDFAKKRHAFHAELAQKPLHLDTLAGMQAEAEAAFHFSFRVAELLGAAEAGDEAEENELLRTLTPLCKLTTGKQVVALASEAVEGFGGAGYVEDTGIPRLLRDAQVLSIWEGTTNVLSLDALRALGSKTALEALIGDASALTSDVTDPELLRLAGQATDTIRAVGTWLKQHDAGAAEAGARRACLSLGRAYQLALLVRHASWSLTAERDGRAKAAALRFESHGVNLLRAPFTNSAALALDETLAV